MHRWSVVGRLGNVRRHFGIVVTRTCKLNLSCDFSGSNICDFLDLLDIDSALILRDFLCVISDYNSYLRTKFEL